MLRPAKCCFRRMPAGVMGAIRGENRAIGLCEDAHVPQLRYNPRPFGRSRFVHARRSPGSSRLSFRPGASGIRTPTVAYAQDLFGHWLGASFAHASTSKPVNKRARLPPRSTRAAFQRFRPIYPLRDLPLRSVPATRAQLFPGRRRGAASSSRSSRSHSDDVYSLRPMYTCFSQLTRSAPRTRKPLRHHRHSLEVAGRLPLTVGVPAVAGAGFAG